MSFLASDGRGVAAALLWVCVLVLGGCNRGGVSPVAAGPSTEQLISYYSPKSIEILSFTKPRSFDDDAIPDGVAVYVQPLDAAGDSVKAYGTFVFELYSYRPASANRWGQLLQSWTQPVVTPEDQKQFWERVTKTYEFLLSWEGRPLAPQKRYVLTASFQAPGTKRLFDEYEFEFRVHRKEILNAITEPES